MNALKAQLRFDFTRLVFRDYSYQFFTTIMPLCFYLLFTKIFVVGNGAVMKIFNKSYLSSMIIYSLLISAIFGFAQIIRGDRDQGLTNFLSLTPHGRTFYYLSVGFWMIILNLISTFILTVVAVVVNGVELSGIQWVGLLIFPQLGQIPLLLIGLALSNITRQETLSVVCNLITFPMAIISGLWWPLNTMPSWIRPIGKVMPTYFANDILTKTLLNKKIELTDFAMIVLWTFLCLILSIVVNKLIRKKDLVVSET